MAKAKTTTTRKSAARKPAAKKGAAKKATTGRVVAPKPDAAADDARKGSVVGLAFKQRYAEKGRPNDCGDWLALQLDEALPKPIDPARLAALAKANGLAEKFARWSHVNIGQQRMLLGLALRPVVATEGKLVIPGERSARKPPRAFVEKHGH